MSRMREWRFSSVSEEEMNCAWACCSHGWRSIGVLMKEIICGMFRSRFWVIVCIIAVMPGSIKRERLHEFKSYVRSIEILLNSYGKFCTSEAFSCLSSLRSGTLKNWTLSIFVLAWWMNDGLTLAKIRHGTGWKGIIHDELSLSFSLCGGAPMRRSWAVRKMRRGPRSKVARMAGGMGIEL